MSTPEDQIVFEDLHGANEDKSVTIDLDVDRKVAGIETTPAEQAAADDAGNDDQLVIDELRSADNDAGQQVADDDQASTDNEDDDYSKKVKARIEREARAKRKERQRADQQTQRADYWERQATELAKNSYEGEKRNLELSIEQTDSAITQVQADLERAIEEGQTKDQVRLTNRLTDLKADKAKAEFGLNDLSPDGNVQPFDDKISPEGRKDTKSKADKWMEDRSDWYGAKGFERQTRLANRLDKEVYKDGYDPGTEEYFEELDRRIKEKEPKLFDDLDAGADDNDTDDKNDRRGKNVVAPVGGNETRHQRTSGSKVDLTPEDFDTMREFNLDTNDPEVLKEFARNKVEAEGRG
jgi:hypothetical protein